MGKFGNIKLFFSAKGLNSGESVEKFKQGLNNIANPYRLFTTMLLFGRGPKRVMETACFDANVQ